MRRIAFSLLLTLILLVVSSGVAQTPAAGDEQQLLALLKDVQTQQTQIVANQAKIDSKLADLAQTIDQARIYSKRSR
jgi:outer membrane lipoprotein-sorting protein